MNFRKTMANSKLSENDNYNVIAYHKITITSINKLKRNENHV